MNWLCIEPLWQVKTHYNLNNKSQLIEFKAFIIMITNQYSAKSESRSKLSKEWNHISLQVNILIKYISSYTTCDYNTGQWSILRSFITVYEGSTYGSQIVILLSLDSFPINLQCLANYQERPDHLQLENSFPIKLLDKMSMWKCVGLRLINNLH